VDDQRIDGRRHDTRDVNQSYQRETSAISGMAAQTILYC